MRVSGYGERTGMRESGDRRRLHLASGKAIGRYDFEKSTMDLAGLRPARCGDLGATAQRKALSSSDQSWRP